jgi:hypothetical protein
MDSTTESLQALQLPQLDRHLPVLYTLRSCASIATHRVALCGTAMVLMPMKNGRAAAETDTAFCPLLQQQ